MAPGSKDERRTTTVVTQSGTDTFRFTWRIDEFSQKKLIKKKLSSDIFEFGGYKWRILIFPNGNNVDFLSVYLEVADSYSLPYDWSRYAKFSFTVVNQMRYNLSKTKDTQYHFNERDRDWGFTSFIPFSELFDPSRGYLVKNSLVVEVEVTCNVGEKENEDQYTYIKVVRDEDLAEQIGKDIFFDLVHHEKGKMFRVHKKTSFKVFKEEVAKEFGIQARFLRFWLWEKRQNNTYRPSRPLTHIEEAQSVGQFNKVTKTYIEEFELFLEVEREPDLGPMAPFKRSNDDILLFFKLYDPEKEELRYVGKLFVNCGGKPSKVLTELNKLVGYDPGEEINLYEEIKFAPVVICEPVDKKLTFQQSELGNGDIICFQKASAMDNVKLFCYPNLPSYLNYVRSRYTNVATYVKYVNSRKIPFSSSEKESKDERSSEKQIKNIIDQQTNVNENTDAQKSKVKIETTHDEGEYNNSKFDHREMEKIDAMVDEDVIAAIDKILSEGIIISLQYQPSNQEQEKVSKLLQELRNIAFKEYLVKKFKKGLVHEVNFNAVKEKIDTNADLFSSHQLEQVSIVVNLLNNIVRVFEKLGNLKKERDSAKKSIDQDIEALKETRQKILTSKTSFTNHQTRLDYLDAELADFKAKLEKLQGDRTKIAETQDQEKHKISSLNKEVKLIFRRLVDDQIKLKSVEDQILEAQTELKSHEKLYQTFRKFPPF
ncbi:ubiquitin carboxyl-terminal hydrolase [Trifolium repens]|nr:ubiquitin carboxyl-terminal hydrolase [Trifolium repens]